MSSCKTEYISVGGNRQSAAADCSTISGLVAFGADVNIALWQPQDPTQTGIRALLKGHTDRVTAARFSAKQGDDDTLVSGSGNGEIRVWRGLKSDSSWQCLNSAKGHDGAVNVITFLEDSSIFATGGSDGLVQLWRLEDSTLALVHNFNLKPRYIPLAIVLGAFSGEDRSERLFAAVGGTQANVQIFVVEDLNGQPQHELQATLTGHEGWIRSLSLLILKDEYLLASASHDKYVRIWRIQENRLKAERDPTCLENTKKKTLTRKVQTLRISDSAYTIIFEALLLGHEDWVYSASWSPVTQHLQLLTASADGSLSIWEPDPSSGIWVSTSRLGEINSQKGATTATGSAGGFWVAMWSPDSQGIISLDRTGSWRQWRHDQGLDYWNAKSGVSGHIGPANGIAWSKGGHYLLSTGSDQTSRVHAEWRRDKERTWHEFARPQIHGYDLNCITSVSPQSFVSGADEKLLRVFDEPKNVAGMLERLCGIKPDDRTDLPDAANMPVLGLSNKAAETQSSPNAQGDAAAGPMGPEPGTFTMTLDGDEPPTEDLLARHTLWPEHEKLYGHGYEISEAASNDEGTVLATACKASSTDHAVIRLYDTRDWHEMKPALVAHSLTVTRLVFAPGEQRYLLSVGRDRQWTVFQREEDGLNTWNNCQTFPKAHSRMILDAAWSPVLGDIFFATAGRDKLVKLWLLVKDRLHQNFALAETVARRSAVTAISFTSNRSETSACLAVGEEDGLVSLHLFALQKGLSLQKSWDVDTIHCPAKSVTRIQWRPKSEYWTSQKGTQLAIAAADGSVRVLLVNWEESDKDISKELEF